jgi:hypothetical protein
VSANKKYKDSVFTLLFAHPETLRELYGAITGVEVPPDVPVTINTLKNALFLARINDISFTIGDKVIALIEHQSTVNQNMPLRLLLYIARVYEKIIDKRSLYKALRVTIPRPEFIVLYNGVEPYPDEATLNLSDAFADKSAAPELELAVRVFNINEGHNQAMLGKCPKLGGYAAFVDKVREAEAVERRGKKKLTRAAKQRAMTGAVNWCIDHVVLPEFLTNHSSEVINMLTQKWDWKVAFEVYKEEVTEQVTEQNARNALALGLPVDVVQKITGLDTQTITQLSLK